MPEERTFLFRWRFLINEIILRLVLSGGGVALDLYFPSFERRVQGKDWSDYGYPYTPDEIFSKTTTALVLAATTLLVLMLGLLLLKWQGNWPKKILLEESILYFLGVTLSGMVTFVISTITKKMYGRLRPDFLARCFGENNPKVWMAANSFASWTAIPEIPVCSANTGNLRLSDKALHDGRMSFPSNHSSLSFSVIGFVALWAYAKLCLFRDWGSWRLVLPLSVLMVPTVIALSRTSDYRHHPTDVIGGSLLGVSLAILSFRFFFPIRMSPIAEPIYKIRGKIGSNVKLGNACAARLRSFVPDSDKEESALGYPKSSTTSV